jgi:hypothetical protein
MPMAGQQLLHQIECIQAHAAPVGAEKASLAPGGLLGSAKQCNSFHRNRKNLSRFENAAPPDPSGELS